jgi:hypothetical protein
LSPYGSINAARRGCAIGGASLFGADRVSLLHADYQLILSGIPGTVGSGSRDVIGSLGRLNDKRAAIWPFDGKLDELLSVSRVVVGEFYPRSMYAHALLDIPSDKRCLLGLGKTKANVRHAAIDLLTGLQWHRDLGVLLDEELLERVRQDEEDFDAYSSALAILRMVMENAHLEDHTPRATSKESGRPLIDGVAEGGMLGVGDATESQTTGVRRGRHRCIGNGRRSVDRTSASESGWPMGSRHSTQLELRCQQFE